MRWYPLVLLTACGGNELVLDASVDASEEQSTNDAPASDVIVEPNPTDAKLDALGDVDAASFNVGNVSGLVLWLRADLAPSITLVNGHVTKWADQTTHHNDATGVVNTNPTLATKIINGNDAVSFAQGTQTGNMLSIVDNADGSLQWGAGDFYVSVVATFDNNIAGGQDIGVATFYSKLSGNDGVLMYGNVPSQNPTPQLGFTAGTAFAGNYWAWSGGTFNNGIAHQFGCRRVNGNSFDLLVDGKSISNIYPNTYDVSNVGTITHIGAEGNATIHRLNGSIGEVIAIKGTISTADELGIENHLRAKWGTP